MESTTVLQNIKTPSASIHDGFVTYNVKLKDGQELKGLVRAKDARTLRMVEAGGKERFFLRTDVADLRLGADSLMPAGLLNSLTGQQVVDLLTFLLNAPPSRSKVEVQTALAHPAVPPDPSPPLLRIVLVASKQDHGYGQHDYPAWQKAWHELLAKAPYVTVADAWLWPTEEQFRQAGVLVFYYWNREWNDTKLQQLDEYLARGGGMVVLHSAVIGNPDPPALAERIGLSSWSGKTKYRHTPIDLNIVAPTDHPIMRGLPRQIRFVDEPYWPLVGDTNKIDVLATSELDGGTRPIMCTFHKGKGRVFVSIFGHYTWTLDDPFFRAIVLRAIGWAAVADVRRLEGLVQE
jgi:putative heme-binding domain-containing protein